jgi:hypothetical protein
VKVDAATVPELVAILANEEVAVAVARVTNPIKLLV